MEGRPQAALGDAQLGAQAAEGYPVHVMLEGYVGKQSVAKEALGKHSSRSSSEGAVAVVAVTLFQFVAHDLLPYGIDLDNRTSFAALGIQRAAAVRTTLRSGHRFMAGDLLIREAAAAMAGMTRFGAAPALRAFRRGIGFDGALCRGSG